MEYFYLRKIVQDGISISRASAVCLNLNCFLILLPVCRNLITYLRNLNFCSLSIKRGLFDKHITYHRYIGYMIIIFSIVHVMGHIHNFENFVKAWSFSSTINFTDTGLISSLTLLPVNPNETYLNPIRTSNSNAIFESFKLISGITGIIMCLILSIMVSTSNEYIRRSFYNLFWFIHQIGALIFLIALCLHGLQMIIRKQTNTDTNNPLKCYLKYKDWSNLKHECDIPQFVGSMPSSWIYILPSLIIYLIERLLRFIRGLRSHKVISTHKHPSGVLEIRIENTRSSAKYIKYSAGQYIYLNYPKLSRLEWHPFTITSAPDDPHLSIHIRTSGDWTSNLAKEASIKEIHLDGPYGSCAEDIFDYQHVILIGAGIGVTPYASILSHILNMLKYKTLRCAIEKVHFFWICPSIDTFEWFGILLKNLEQEINSLDNKRDFLEYKIHLTKGWSLKEANQIAQNEYELYDLFTGLQQKTFYGRPNFNIFFKDLSSSPQDLVTNKIGVFYCGPSELSSELHKLCNKYSNDNLKFIYNKESF